MRNILLAALFAAFALAVVPAAVATTSNTAAVSIKSGGFDPKTVTINVGDSVKWTNNTTVDQKVSCPKCQFTSPVVPAGGTYTYTFATPGTFGIVDPLDTSIKGTVTVAAASGSVTLTAAPGSARYGNSAVLSGTISSAKPNQRVTILAKEAGEAVFTSITTTTTSAGGNFTVTQTPSVNTRYEARWATVTSPVIRVLVQPRITLVKHAHHRFGVSVKAAKSLVGKTVFFQTLTARGTWAKLKRVNLTTALSAGTATITQKSFTAKVRHGRRVRVLLPSGQAAVFYIGAHSNMVRA